MQRLEVSFFVERRLGLDQLTIDPLEKRILAHGKRIQLRLSNHILAISSRTGDRLNGVTDGTCDGGMGCGVVVHVKVGIVKCATEEWNRVMAAGTESGGMDVAIPLQEEITGVFDARQVGRVVE